MTVLTRANHVPLWRIRAGHNLCPGSALLRFDDYDRLLFPSVFDVPYAT